MSLYYCIPIQELSIEYNFIIYWRTHKFELYFICFQLQEDLTSLPSPPSVVSIGSVPSTPEKERDLQNQVLHKCRCDVISFGVTSSVSVWRHQFRCDVISFSESVCVVICCLCDPHVGLNIIIVIVLISHIRWRETKLTMLADTLLN